MKHLSTNENEIRGLDEDRKNKSSILSYISLHLFFGVLNAVSVIYGSIVLTPDHNKSNEWAVATAFIALLGFIGGPIATAAFMFGAVVIAAVYFLSRLILMLG